MLALLAIREKQREKQKRRDLLDCEAPAPTRLTLSHGCILIANWMPKSARSNRPTQEGRTMRIGLSILFFVSFAGMTQSAAFGGDSDKLTMPGEVTFSKDVAPILQRSCQTCHRPG